MVGTIEFFRQGLKLDAGLLLTAGIVALMACVQVFGLCTKRAKDAEEENLKIN